MAVPELSLATIRRFCREAAPPPLNREVRLEITVRGDSVTIFERRPPAADSEEWTRMHAAQLRYDATGAQWSLYWRCKSRWEPYADKLNLAKALQIIGDDKLGAFFT